MRAGWTGGLSVSADVGGTASPGSTGGAGGAPWAPAVGWSACAGGADMAPFAAPFVPPDAAAAVSAPILRALTSGVRMPRSSCTSASRKRDASQRMM